MGNVMYTECYKKKQNKLKSSESSIKNRFTLLYQYKGMLIYIQSSFTIYKRYLLGKKNKIKFLSEFD